MAVFWLDEIFLKLKVCELGISDVDIIYVLIVFAAHLATIIVMTCVI